MKRLSSPDPKVEYQERLQELKQQMRECDTPEAIYPRRPRMEEILHELMSIGIDRGITRPMMDLAEELLYKAKMAEKHFPELVPSGSKSYSELPAREHQLYHGPDVGDVEVQIEPTIQARESEARDNAKLTCTWPS